jgi:tetraacyldisaccharide 4'-kinase
VKAPAFWFRPPGAAARLLAPAAAAWTAATRRRIAATRPAAAGVPVICVGNPTAGGSGKTPIAIDLAQRLLARGIDAALLSRGYRGRLAGPVRVDPAAHDAADVGDEPLLLAAAAPTWVARDRVAGARAAVAAGAQAIVMDDGFQNPSLAKDLSILVVDGATGFGNGRVMPAGPLREPLADGLASADAVVVMGDDAHGLAAALAGRSGRAGPLAVLGARLAVPEAAAARWRGRAAVAFAGIGRPAKFFETLEGVGARLVATAGFADHHRYGVDEVMHLVEIAAEADAIPVTTAKDWVRLPDKARPMVEILPVAVAWDDAAGVAALLDRIAGPREVPKRDVPSAAKGPI